MGPGGVMHYEFAKMSMTGIADILSSFLDRPVVDMTEMKGDHQFSLDVTLEDMKGAARAAGVAMPSAGGAATAGGGPDAGKMPADAASDPSGSTLFRSVQQLGLKLEARKAPDRNYRGGSRGENADRELAGLRASPRVGTRLA